MTYWCLDQPKLAKILFNLKEVSSHVKTAKKAFKCVSNDFILDSLC